MVFIQPPQGGGHIQQRTVGVSHIGIRWQGLAVGRIRCPILPLFQMEPFHQDLLDVAVGRPPDIDTTLAGAAGAAVGEQHGGVVLPPGDLQVPGIAKARGHLGTRVEVEAGRLACGRDVRLPDDFSIEV